MTEKGSTEWGPGTGYEMFVQEKRRVSSCVLQAKEGGMTRPCLIGFRPFGASASVHGDCFTTASCADPVGVTATSLGRSTGRQLGSARWACILVLFEWSVHRSRGQVMENPPKSSGVSPHHPELGNPTCPKESGPLQQQIGF